MTLDVPIEYSYFYTQKNQGEQINNILLIHSNKESIITDATSCIGGNTTLFCRDFLHVNAVEKDPRTVIILRDNLKDFCNKDIINLDYNTIRDTLIQDIVFIDPPWGGRGYKKLQKIDLNLSGVDVYDIIEDLHQKTNVVCLKCPVNYNFRESKKWTTQKYPIYKFSHVIFNVIIYKHVNRRTTQEGKESIEIKVGQKLFVKESLGRSKQTKEEERRTIEEVV
jgi:predicted RNA methylase